MRIAIVDYSGHAFAVQLSRALAAREHEVLHLHFSEFQSPHGKLEQISGDPAHLTIKPISLGVPFRKYSLLRRRFQEVKIGRAFASEIAMFAPDVVVAGNCPLDCVSRIGSSTRRSGGKFVFWQQDIYSAAITRILGHKLGWLGRLIGAYYRHIERGALRASDATIVISQDFVETIRQELSLSVRNVHVIENWAPIDELPLRPKDNAWSRRHGLASQQVILYSGTIGLKHDPQQLLDLAVNLRDHAETTLVVVSEGPYADWLAEQFKLLELGNVLVLPFQPFEDFPDVLGSADIAIAILEPDAGAFSVPSKILSYLCAGRPIVLSSPRENLAARIVNGCQAGYVVDAGNRIAFVEAVKLLMHSSQLRMRAGQNARAYAEATFDIDVVATRFEDVFYDTLAGRHMSKTGAANLQQDAMRSATTPTIRHR
jgi:putative colanic acid biosynthesis glycosyltransferase WcaI